MAQQSNTRAALTQQWRASTPSPYLPHRQDKALCLTHPHSLHTAYLAPHDSNLLVKLSPVKARVFLEERAQRTREIHLLPQAMQEMPIPQASLSSYPMGFLLLPTLNPPLLAEG